MKKLMLILLCLVTVCAYRAQEKINYGKIKKPYPNSIIELGAGLGPNFGVIGGQMVLGYKGSGLLLGAGSFNNQFNYAIGLQLGHEWFCFSISRAVVGSSIRGRART